MRNIRVIESDNDCKSIQRVFTGRMTKGRYKIIARYVRSQTYRIGYCGHDWDCCGCLTSQYAKFSYKYNQVTITVTQNFNY